MDTSAINQNRLSEPEIMLNGQFFIQIKVKQFSVLSVFFPVLVLSLFRVRHLCNLLLSWQMSLHLCLHLHCPALIKKQKWLEPNLLKVLITNNYFSTFFLCRWNSAYFYPLRRWQQTPFKSTLPEIILWNLFFLFSYLARSYFT